MRSLRDMANFFSTRLTQPSRKLTVQRPRSTSWIAFAACVAVALLCPRHTLAGPYDPPPTYYNSAIGTGLALKSQLHNIIDGHTIRSYSAAREILKDTDVDPNNSSRILLVYDRETVTASNHSSWNREHTWPKARGVITDGGPDGSDLHQLRPSTIQVNSDRGSLNFGGAYGAQSFGTLFDKGQLVWYPGDADAGMIARQQFYMAVRYDGSDSNSENLELVNGSPAIGGTTMGDLARLLEWHYAAVPDDFELRRNDVIYDDYQGNRNPFIDRPEFVWSVFVDQQNDSQLAVAGATPNSNGGTTLPVHLGRVLTGATVPAIQSITLNKSGNDGTYFSVETSGLATSNLDGRLNAFRTGGTDSVTLDVGLNTNTLIAGQRSGSVTIDNLDVTSDGGAGRGANDANDVIDISLDVLDHANPSFAADNDINELLLEFGTFTQGAATPTLQFDLFNLETVVGYTAGMELDSIIGLGDTTTITTDVQGFGESSVLDAGAGIDFSASLDTSATGNFLAHYILKFSDEDLPGASSVGDLLLTLTANIESADFDQDTDVDGADFLTWQRSLLTGSSQAEGDANGDLGVDELDLAVWNRQVQAAAVGGIRSVPEPSTAYLCCGAVLAILQGRSSRQIF